MIDKSEWKWYGYPGHFIGSARCVYHLSTKVGDYLISTVGDYRPNGPYKAAETLRWSEDSYFETMVFEVDGETEAGDPNVVSEVEGFYWSKSIIAENKHYEICQKYAEMQG